MDDLHEPYLRTRARVSTLLAAADDDDLARTVPAIVARGRKGGSTVATAIVNALLYEITRAGHR